MNSLRKSVVFNENRWVPATKIEFWAATGGVWAPTGEFRRRKACRRPTTDQWQATPHRQKLLLDVCRLLNIIQNCELLMDRLRTCKIILILSSHALVSARAASSLSAFFDIGCMEPMSKRGRSAPTGTSNKCGDAMSPFRKKTAGV